MARIDQHTGKKAMVGNNRSHALNATKRKWNLNLQQVKVKTAAGSKKIKVSARTLKTLKKQQKIAN